MRRALLVFFACLASRLCCAAEISLSLSDAIHQARERSPERVMSQERVRQAVARTYQAYTTLLPQVSAEVSQGRETRNLDSVGISLPGATDPVVGPYNSFGAKIKISQIVFDGAAIERLLAVRAGEKTARSLDKKLEEDVMALVAGLYLDAERASQATRIANAFFTRDLKRLKIAHQAFRLGNAASLEIKEAKVLYKESIARIWQSKNLARERLADLLVALGYDAKDNITLIAQKDKERFGIPLEVRFDPESHPEGEAAKGAVIQRKIEEGINWAEYFPKLSFMADYGASGEEPGESEVVYSVGVKATMPIFEGGQRPFRIAEAHSRRVEAEIAAKDALSRLEADVRQALDELLVAKQFLNAKASGVEAARERLDNTKTRYRNGSGTEWDWVQAVFESEAALDQKNQAENDFLKAHVRLAHSLGDVERLAQKNKADVG